MVDLDEMTAFARAVGHVLRTARKRRKWTLDETGRRVGLSVSVLCRLELGTRPLDMTRFVGLCSALGVPPARVIALAQAEAFPLGWPGDQPPVRVSVPSVGRTWSPPSPNRGPAPLRRPDADTQPEQGVPLIVTSVNRPPVAPDSTEQAQPTPGSADHRDTTPSSGQDTTPGTVSRRFGPTYAPNSSSPHTLTVAAKPAEQAAGTDGPSQDIPRVTKQMRSVLAALLLHPQSWYFGATIASVAKLKPIRTVYPIMDRLLEAGLVCEREDRDPYPDGHPRRRYFRITYRGTVAARTDLEQPASTDATGTDTADTSEP